MVTFSKAETSSFRIDGDGGANIQFFPDSLFGLSLIEGNEGNGEVDRKLKGLRTKPSGSRYFCC